MKRGKLFSVSLISFSLLSLLLETPFRDGTKAKGRNDVADVFIFCALFVYYFLHSSFYAPFSLPLILSS